MERHRHAAAQARWEAAQRRAVDASHRLTAAVEVLERTIADEVADQDLAREILGRLPPHMDEPDPERRDPP